MLDGHQQKIRVDGQNWGNSYEENNKIKVVVSVSRKSQWREEETEFRHSTDEREKKIKVAVDVETCSLAEIDEGHPN